VKNVHTLKQFFQQRGFVSTVGAPNEKALTHTEEGKKCEKE
jgi:hypothetical protein